MLARDLAEVFVAGPWQQEDLVARGSRALARRGRWFLPLVSRLLARFPAGVRPARARVAAFLRDDGGLGKACRRTGGIEVTGRLRPAPEMAPAAGVPADWPLPVI